MYKLFTYLSKRLWILAFGLIIPANLYAQTLTIKGKVTSEKDEPLPGVNIIIKGTVKGAVTDVNGLFSIDGVDSKTVLVFSFIGFNTEEVTVGNSTNLSVSLLPDIKSLSEVVVVGYGTQRKTEITGSIASIKAEELVQTPVSNVAQGIQARVAGVQITQNSSAPGGNISVRVRGINSISGSSEPLYVIDGIQISNSGGINEVSPLSTINPNDIESIEILKDASSTAIYGSRGANGVVLITTKRGKSGATRVAFESYYGTQQITKKINMLDAAGFAALENEIYRTAVYPDPASLGAGVNWQDLVYRDAPIQSHQVTVTGGNEKTQLSLSANYFDQDGIAINSDFQRSSLRFTLDHRLNDRFKIGTSLLGSYSLNNVIPTGVSSIDGPATTGSMVGAALGAPPTLQPYDAFGAIFPFGNQFNSRYREVVNPLGIAAVLNRTAIFRTLGNVYAEAKIIEGLTYRASFNIDFQSQLNDFYSPRFIVNTSDLNANSGTGAKNNRRFTRVLHESILTYTKTFNDIHSLKLTGVFATQADLENRNSASGSGFPSDETTNERLDLAVNRSISSFRFKGRLDSYMGRVNYGFKDKYFVDVTARVDGADVFGANNKYGFFPAVGAAWRITEEPFMKNLTWLSDLKLRGSYGSTGNAGAIENYKSLSLSGPGSNYQFNHVYAVGISPIGIPNPDLRWERSIQSNVGLDIGLLNNRLNFVVDGYSKRTEDLLFDQPLPLSSGYSTYTTNFATIVNRGLEFAANAVLSEGDFKWNVSANITFNRNEVESVGSFNEILQPNNISTIGVGRPLGVFKTYVFDGIYQTGETILPGSGSRVGGTRVKDINGDNQITSADLVFTGDPNPDFIYGFSTNASFKGFDLSVFFAGSQGNDIYNLSRYSFENPLGQRNVVAEAVNRWSPTNANNEFVSGFQGGRLPITDRFVEDGSFLRCKNITLGYRVPTIKGINSLRVYVSANNLFTITNYTGYDPEVNTFGGSNTQLGVDNLVYPNSRSFLGGIQLAF
jgi:TonB-dependent starch-binding outer membrane protein SusC